MLLYSLEKQDAEDLLDALSYQNERLLDHLDAILRRQSDSGRGI